MTLDIHNWSSSAHQEIHKIVKDEIFPIVNQVDARVQYFKIQFLKEASKFVRDFKSLSKEADESLAKHKALELEIERLLRNVVSQDIMSIVQNPTIVETFDLQTELERTKERLENCIIKKEKEYVVLWNNWYTKCEECKYDKISYDKSYNDMKEKIKRLQAQLGDQKGKCKDTSCVSDTLDPLPQKLENENTELEINPFKAFRVDNFVPNKHVKASVRTKPITVSQPHVITKNDVNSKTNGFSPKDVKSTTRTTRPQPRYKPKNDKVHSKSKSSWLSINLEKKEANHRNLQSSSNQKHMSYECNNIKLVIQNAKSKVVCAMCKQCVIIVNHDVCVLNYVNGMNSRALNKNSNVSNVENQKKHKPKVKKPKKVGSKERLASPKPSTPRSCLSQNQRDLPRNTLLDRVEVLGMIEKRSKVRMGIMLTETELALEQSQQGVSYEVSAETGSIHMLSVTQRCYLTLKTVIMDPVMQCTTLPSHSRSLKRHLFHFSRSTTRFYRLSYSEIVDIEKVAVRSSLRSPNNKCALIESKANEINQ
ncbi:hypothetical protein Tco_1531005 [Tanacetum coccineum]